MTVRVNQAGLNKTQVFPFKPSCFPVAGGIRYSSKYHASPRSSSLAPSGLSAADLQQSRGSPGKGWSVYPRTEQNWIRPPASLGAISASTDSDDAKAVLRIEEQPTEEALHVWQSKRAVLFHAACMFSSDCQIVPANGLPSASICCHKNYRTAFIVALNYR